MTSARRLLLLAQLAFWTCTGLCFAVTGGGLSNNHGLSIYGGQWSTVVPWIVGFAAAAFLTLRAADALDADDPMFACVLRVNVILLLSIPATPDTVGQFFYVAHVVASIALFLFQAIAGLWLVGRSPVTPLVQLYAVQIAAGIVAGLSQLQWLDLLSLGIVVFQLAFGALLVSFPGGARREIARARA